MSLGFARDSILDLAAMGKEHEEAEAKAATTDQVEIPTTNMMRVNSSNSIRSTGSGHGHIDTVVTLPKGGVYFRPDQSRSFTEHDKQQIGSSVGVAIGGGESPKSVTVPPASVAQVDPAKIIQQLQQEQKREQKLAKEAAAKSSDTAYSAFAYGYAEYADYYAEADAMTGSKSDGGGLFCCLFAPWSKSIEDDDDEDDTGAGGLPKGGSASDDDDDDDDAPLPLNPNDSIDMTKARKLGLVKDAEEVAEEKGAAAAEEKEKEAAPAAVSDDDGAAPEGGPEEEEEKKGEEEGGFDDEFDEEETTDNVSAASGASGASGDTDVYGERLSDKDRQAVLARLRMSEPSSPESDSPPNEVSTTTTAATAAAASAKGDEPAGTGGTKRKTAVKSEPSPPDRRPKKGILKHRTSTLTPKGGKSTDSNKGGDKSSGSSTSDPNAKDRRSLFPSYTPRVHPDPESGGGDADAAGSGNVQKKSCTFSPMARVVTVTSRADMTFVDKSQIWWQRSDYNDFKKTGRIIAKAMLQGGSQVWLASNNAWERRQQSRSAGSVTSGGKVCDDYNSALQKYVGGQDAGEEPVQGPPGGGDDGSKWWCQFGHSRRGLEHIASMEEGRQRQRNVNTSIKAIMDEQRSQRMSHKKDPVKLARVALQYTSWARDLSLAAAAADADAVRTNFCQSNSKTRAHYLRTGVNSVGSGQGGGPSAGESTQGKVSAGQQQHHNIAPNILDANTSTHILLERKDAKAAAANAAKQQSAVSGAGPVHPAPATAPRPAPAASASPTEGGGGGSEEEEDGTAEPGEEAIHDPDLSHESIAKMAAGFNQHEDDHVDMSAVLTGMGPVHKDNSHDNLAQQQSPPGRASVGAH